MSKQVKVGDLLSEQLFIYNDKIYARRYQSYISSSYRDRCPYCVPGSDFTMYLQVDTLVTPVDVPALMEENERLNKILRLDYLEDHEELKKEVYEQGYRDGMLDRLKNDNKEWMQKYSQILKNVSNNPLMGIPVEHEIPVTNVEFTENYGDLVREYLGLPVISDPRILITGDPEVPKPMGVIKAKDKK